MQDNVRQLRERSIDTEKITINLGFVDLGRIDLLVQEGFYSNRSDCIRTAIRNHLADHAPDVAQSVARQTLEVGLRDYSAAELEALRDQGRTLNVRVLGLARIATDVTPDLARATIASMTVLGALHATPEVRAALAGRIH